MTNESNKHPTHYPYRRLHEFFDRHRLFRKDGIWRLTEPRAGEINGLPNFRGLLVATNGILCYLETETGRLFEGHIDWFVPDQKDRPLFEADGKTLIDKTIPKKPLVDIQELLNLMK